MADFKATCPGCNGLLEYDPSLIGQVGTCPHCGASFIYPEPVFTSPPPPSQPQPGTPPQTGTQSCCPACARSVPPYAGDRCPFCGTPLTPGAAASIPWENRKNLGFFNALFATIKQVLFEPSDFFRRMPVTGGLGNPLLFFVIIVTVAFWACFALQLLILYGRGCHGSDLFLELFPRLLLLVAPFFAAIGVFIGSAILHLCLMIVGGANRTYEATFRVVCYAAAAHVWLLIPFCGGLIAVVWNIVLNAIGLSRAHYTSVGRAVLAIFLPALVGAFCLVLLLVMFIVG